MDYGTGRDASGWVEGVVGRHVYICTIFVPELQLRRERNWSLVLAGCRLAHEQNK